MKLISSRFALILCTFLPFAAGAAHAADADGEKHRLEARLDWAQRVELGLVQSGVIAQVAVKTGDFVKAGQTLLSLEQTRFQADIKAAQAALRRAQVAHDEAKRELERTQALHEQTLIAAHEFELANNAFIAAQAAADQAQAQLAQAQASLTETRIRAPFAGRVIALNAAVGQAVVNRCQAQPLVVLADTQTMRARAWLPAQAAAKVQAGQTLDVQVQGQSYSGTVMALGWEAQEQQGVWVYPLEVSLTGKDNLRAGLPAFIDY